MKLVRTSFVHSFAVPEVLCPVEIQVVWLCCLVTIYLVIFTIERFIDIINTTPEPHPAAPSVVF